MGGVHREFGKYHGGIARALISQLATRFHSTSERDIAGVLVRSPEASVTLPKHVTHKYDPDFRGAPWESQDYYGNVVMTRPRPFHYVQVTASLTPEFAIKVLVDGEEPRTKVEREYYVQAVWEYFFG